jgi:7,8-dihydropterin-6-yl-methyl-4-(beta-D-ribofuranosyl)aminobenzene 5'-phosphate synthase
MASTGLERVTITSVTENYVDMLLADGPNVTRAGLRHHFDPQHACPVGENGIALLVEVEWDRYRYSALFDTGMTGPVLTHNADALGVDLGSVDHVVISHGHPDHYGGLEGFLAAREAPVPISIHGDAFLPRYLRLASGQVAPFYNQDLTLARIDALGGRPLLHRGPVTIGPGMIATGEIPRNVAFEAPPSRIDTPNALIQLRDGYEAPDTVPDDQALVLEVGHDGIIVLVGCSHAGVINSVRYAMEITGRDRVLGVFGGFHLGFPGIPEVKTEQTIEALREIDVEVLCPMHCTGMRAMMEMQRAFPDRFLMNCTGTRVHFDGLATASIAAPRKAGAGHDAGA